MHVTYHQLFTWDACAEGIDWFEETYGCDSAIPVQYLLADCPYDDWVVWYADTWCQESKKGGEYAFHAAATGILMAALAFGQEVRELEPYAYNVTPENLEQVNSLVQSLDRNYTGMWGASRSDSLAIRNAWYAALPFMRGEAERWLFEAEVCRYSCAIISPLVDGVGHYPAVILVNSTLFGLRRMVLQYIEQHAIQPGTWQNPRIILNQRTFVCDIAHDGRMRDSEGEEITR